MTELRIWISAWERRDGRKQHGSTRVQGCAGGTVGENSILPRGIHKWCDSRPAGGRERTVIELGLIIDKRVLNVKPIIPSFRQKNRGKDLSWDAPPPN